MKKLTVAVAILLIPVVSIAVPTPKAPQERCMHQQPMQTPTLETIDEMSRRGCYFANIFYTSGATISDNGITQTCTPPRQIDMQLPPPHVWVLVKQAP